MKKIICFVFVTLVTAAVFVGCDQNKSTSTDTNAASTNAAGTNAPAK